MQIRYTAFVILIIVPVVLKVAATSGTADSTAVDDTGARNPQRARTAVITTFRWGDSLSYTLSFSLGGNK